MNRQWRGAFRGNEQFRSMTITAARCDMHNNERQRRRLAYVAVEF